MHSLAANKTNDLQCTLSILYERFHTFLLGKGSVIAVSLNYFGGSKVLSLHTYIRNESLL